MNPFDLFRSSAPAAQPATAAKPAVAPDPNANPAQNRPAAQPGSASVQLENVAAGQQGQPGQQPAGQQSTPSGTIDDFKDLWQPPTTEVDGKGNQGKPKSFLTIDPTKIAESVKKLDYSRLVPPEVMTKALGGDAASMSQLLNTVTQAATANSMKSAVALIESALANAEGRFKEHIPSAVREYNLQDSRDTENPALDHPAIRPMLAGVERQIADKYPDASTADVKKMAKNYLTQALKALNPEAAQDTGKGGKKKGAGPMDLVSSLQSEGSQDWENFFGEAPTQ